VRTCLGSEVIYEKLVVFWDPIIANCSDEHCSYTVQHGVAVNDTTLPCSLYGTEVMTPLES
jgi:hypothetical protein